jgi:hypothetical protein
MNSTTSQQELENAIEQGHQFSHLQVIINGNSGRTVDDQYLCVTRRGFEIVTITDIDYVENRVIYSLKSSVTGRSKEIKLDIDDKSFQFLLLNMEDIKDMIVTSGCHYGPTDELLDFQF